MSLLRAALAVLSVQLVQIVRARRIGYSQKLGIQSREPESATKCQSACGAATVTLSNNSTETEFDVGEGAKVYYKRTDSECLAECVFGQKGKSCASGMSGLQSVAKKGSEKLCCKPKYCTWRVELEDGLSGSWEEMEDRETARLFPLQDFNGGEAHRNSCFCCNEAGVPWNGNVNLKCKLAYGNSGSWWGAVGAALTFSLSDQLWKQGCTTYCRNFAGYTVAKKTFKYKKWKPVDIPIPVDGPKVAAELEGMLRPQVAKASELMEAGTKSSDFDLNRLVDLGDEIREALEQAETEEVSPHMNVELLQEARVTSVALDKFTLPKQVDRACSRFPEAMAAQGNMKKLKEIAEDLEAVIFRADESEGEVRNIGQAKALLHALGEMMKEAAGK